MNWQKIENAPDEVKDMATVTGDNYTAGRLRLNLAVGSEHIYVFYVEGSSSNPKVTRYFTLPSIPA